MNRLENHLLSIFCKLKLVASPGWSTENTKCFALYTINFHSTIHLSDFQHLQLSSITNL